MGGDKVLKIRKEASKIGSSPLVFSDDERFESVAVFMGSDCLLREVVMENATNADCYSA